MFQMFKKWTSLISLRASQHKASCPTAIHHFHCSNSKEAIFPHFEVRLQAKQGTETSLGFSSWKHAHYCRQATITHSLLPRQTRHTPKPTLHTQNKLSPPLFQTDISRHILNYSTDTIPTGMAAGLLQELHPAPRSCMPRHTRLPLNSRSPRDNDSQPLTRSSNRRSAQLHKSRETAGRIRMNPLIAQLLRQVSKPMFKLP